MGEIWVDSPSKAQGYFNHPQETEVRPSLDAHPCERVVVIPLLRRPSNPKQEAFHARLAAVNPAAPEEGQRTYLRTGDLGFLHEGVRHREACDRWLLLPEMGPLFAHPFVNAA